MQQEELECRDISFYSVERPIFPLHNTDSEDSYFLNDDSNGVVNADNYNVKYMRMIPLMTPNLQNYRAQMQM